MNSLKSIYIFQKERFPLNILTFTTLSSALASAAVVSKDLHWCQIATAFVITMFFLFHIRVIDESRDYAMDTGLHPDRPVQRGVISLRRLFAISISGLVISLALAYFSNMPSLIIASLFIVFTSFAWRDFFVPSFFKSRPVLYHLVNSPQMLLAQWLIFALYTASFEINLVMALLILLIYNNIFILELVRKVKAPDKDTADTYSSHLGIQKSTYFIIALVYSGYAIYAAIIYTIAPSRVLFYFLGFIPTLIILTVVWRFLRKPSTGIQKIMELSAVLLYVILNVLIYFSYK